MWEYSGNFTEEQKRVLLSLVAIEKVTTLKLHRVFNDLNGIEKILDLSIPELVIYFGSNAEEIYTKLHNNMEFDFESYFEFYKVKYMICDDVYYPKEFFRVYDYPYVIFYRGNKDLLLFRRKISIVGSRNNTSYSKDALDCIVPYLSMNNFVIVSGLATGVDSLAHEGALKSKGYTIGVIAHGHNIIYPEQKLQAL